MHLVHSVINILHQTTIDIVDIYAQCPNCLLHSVAILAYNIWGGGAWPHGEHGSASLQRRSGGSAPSGVQGQSPWSRGQGSKAPQKLKHFWFLDVQWKLQICPFLYNLKMQKNQTFVLFPKNHGLPQNWGAGAKLGACAPQPGPKPPVATLLLALPAKDGTLQSADMQ